MEEGHKKEMGIFEVIKAQIRWSKCYSRRICRGWENNL